MKKRKKTYLTAFLTLLIVLLVMPSVLVIDFTGGFLSLNLPESANPTQSTPENRPEQENGPDLGSEDMIDLPAFEPWDPEPDIESSFISEPEVLPAFFPRATENTDPDIMLASFGIMADGEIVESFNFTGRSDFGSGSEYTSVDGVTTFKGNNFRDSASFGHVDLRDFEFGDSWSRSTASLRAPNGSVWTGHGWTGQPLIVKWPKQMRELMDMHGWAKEKDELVEVIYPAMDGFIYFSDLETGEDTRSRLFIGFTFKGTGAIDPRGYPLLYVGAGYNSERGISRIFIISLLDGSVLHTFGNADGFALRNWSPADSAPLIDVVNDRLIYPSENGIIYFLDLNSEFDPVEGTVSVDPSTFVKWRYNGRRSSSANFFLGFESSPSALRGHLFIADNGGHLICLDLNTLEPVWVQDVLDDTNTSPVISIEDGHPYLYISTSFRAGFRAHENASATVPVWKIDAETGEFVWRVDYTCFTVRGVSGGVQGTIAVGKHSLRDLIFVPVARTPTGSAGILAAIDKNTGEVVWEYQTSRYSWSSPVCIYDINGNGYIVYTTADANMHLLDGLTGERLDMINLGRLIESSPAVYGNIVVIGTRCQNIWGVELR